MKKLNLKYEEKKTENNNHYLTKTCHKIYYSCDITKTIPDFFLIRYVL